MKRPSKSWLAAVLWMALMLSAALPGQGWTPDPQHPAKARKSAASGEAAKPTATPAPEKDALKPGEWEPFVDPEDQIFPSLLLASATIKDPLRDKETADKAEDPQKSGTSKKPPAGHAAPKPEDIPPEIFGDENGLMGVALVSPSDAAHARVEIKENALMEDSVIEADLPTAGKEYHLMPRVDYKYDALNRVRQSHPVNVTFAVQVDGKPLGQQFVTARVHPINDCPYAYQNPDEAKDYVDIAWMFAAYVNEDHPAIPGLLKEAQAAGVVDGFDAYQSNDPGTVLLQVFAVWEALRQHDIKYSDIGTTTSESDSLYSLHVRFIEEALSESHANCVDASVLLAAVLRRMGIDTFLVLEPGHMYPGDLSGRRGQAIRLSGNHDARRPGPGDPRRRRTASAEPNSASKAVKALKGWRCFNDALDSATREFKKHAPRSGISTGANDPEYEVVDIASRASGGHRAHRVRETGIISFAGSAGCFRSAGEFCPRPSGRSNTPGATRRRDGSSRRRSKNCPLPGRRSFGRWNAARTPWLANPYRLPAWAR